MSEDNTDVEVEESESKATEAEAETPQADPEMEARASRMGWAPKEEFRGDPERWVDAQTFVQRGEEVMPLLKANNRKLEGRIVELERTLKDFADHHTKTQQRMYQKAVRDLKAEQRKAAEEGDLARFDAVNEQIEEVAKEATAGVANGNGKAMVDPVAEQWAQENRWFREDKDMAAWAATHHEFLLQSKPGLTLEENLEEVAKAVKRTFPEKFSNPKRNGHSPVEGNPAPKTKGGKGYADLPADAKEACDRFVKQGLFKDRAAYVKEFFTE